MPYPTHKAVIPLERSQPLSMQKFVLEKAIKILDTRRIPIRDREKLYLLLVKEHREIAKLKKSTVMVYLASPTINDHKNYIFKGVIKISSSPVRPIRDDFNLIGNIRLKIRNL